MGMEVGSVSAKERADQPALEAIGSALHSHAHSLREISGRMSSVLDRVFGPQPQAAATAKPKAVRSGALGLIDDVYDDVRDLTADIASMLARFETLA